MSVTFRGAAYMLSKDQRNIIMLSKEQNKTRDRFEYVGAFDAPYMPRFVSEFRKCHSFCRTTLRNPRYRVTKKVTSLPLPGILGRCKVKNKGIGLKFCTLVVLICLYNLCSVFDIFKFVILWAFIFDKS